MNYIYNTWASFGFRLRSGALDDQQGPHLTLGSGSGEFSLFQIGFEKAYFQAKNANYTLWLGKNSFPFWKQNELFWNNNVYPDGAAFKWNLISGGKGLEKLQFNIAHFIIRSSGKMFWDDAYLNAAQMILKSLQEKLTLAPAIYNFRKLSNIPDQNGSYELDYLIGQISTEYDFKSKMPFRIGAEVYNNFVDYANNDSIATDFKGQTFGWVVNAKLGRMKEKGDWALFLYYAQLQKYAIVDYFAQNDWARWDYSGNASTGYKISNFRGIESRIIYTFGPKFNLTLRVYYTERLLAEGIADGRNSRARLDLNIKF